MCTCHSQGETMHHRIAIAAAATLASFAALVPGSAHATVPVPTVGVLSCSGESTDHGPRGYCTMVTAPGVYRLDLTSTARYGWARVTCDSTGADTYLLHAARWDTDPNYPFADDTGYLPGPTCKLEVAGGAGGTAIGFVRLTP